MDFEYEIIVNPNKQWRRLGYLLKSEYDKKRAINTSIYGTFTYDTDYASFDPYACSLYNKEMEDFEDDILWLKNMVQKGMKHFIDTI